MNTKMMTLDQALRASERLAPADQLRLISLLSERLRGEISQGIEPVDMLSLAGVGAELWQTVDANAYFGR